jgi:hypothetical protein
LRDKSDLKFLIYSFIHQSVTYLELMQKIASYGVDVNHLGTYINVTANGPAFSAAGLALAQRLWNKLSGNCVTAAAIREIKQDLEPLVAKCASSLQRIVESSRHLAIQAPPQGAPPPAPAAAPIALPAPMALPNHSYSIAQQGGCYGCCNNNCCNNCTIL